MQFLYKEFFHNTVLHYLIFLLTVMVSCAVIRIAGGFVMKRLGKWVKRTGSPAYERLAAAARKYLIPIAYILAVYLSTKILYLDAAFTHVIDTAVLALVLVTGAMFLTSVAAFFLGVYWEKQNKNENNGLALKLLSGVIKVIIWGVALILLLDNAGVKINSLITGLGVGGIAIAFAAQSVLTDIFCFFTIFFDRPFEIGDFIVAGDQMGTVEHIGLKTTRLRCLGGEQLIFSNTDLTGSRIRNYKTLEKRRVLFTIGVTYDTPHESLKEIPAIIRDIAENTEGAEFGRAHFFSYGAYSLNFEIAYYILSGDYDQYMDINQSINLRIKEAFDKRGIRFAFPTQNILLQHPSAPPPSEHML